MASIWSKTKLNRAESEEGFGSKEEIGVGEVEKGFRRERKAGGGLRFGEQLERRLSRSNECGVCAISGKESEREREYSTMVLNPPWMRGGERS